MTLAVAECGENTTICAKIFISISNLPQITNPKPKLRQWKRDACISHRTCVAICKNLIIEWVIWWVILRRFSADARSEASSLKLIKAQIQNAQSIDDFG